MNRREMTAATMNSMRENRVPLIIYTHIWPLSLSRSMASLWMYLGALMHVYHKIITTSLAVLLDGSGFAEKCSQTIFYPTQNDQTALVITVGQAKNDFGSNRSTNFIPSKTISANVIQTVRHGSNDSSWLWGLKFVCFLVILLSFASFVMVSKISHSILKYDSPCNK